MIIQPEPMIPINPMITRTRYRAGSALSPVFGTGLGVLVGAGVAVGTGVTVGVGVGSSPSTRVARRTRALFSPQSAVMA